MDEREIGLLLQSVSDGIIVINPATEITVFNPAAASILGIPADRARGARIAEIIPETRLPIVLETGGNELDRQLTYHDINIITSRYALRSTDGTIVGAAAVFREFTDLQRLAEEITNLREMRLLNEAIFESTQDAISVVDESGNGVLVNAAYTRVTGLRQEDVIGKPCTVDIASGESIHMAVLRSGQPIRDRRLRVGPYHRDVMVDANPIVVDGQIRGSVAVIKDVSELRRLHDQLADARAQIRKLEARYTFDDVIGDEPVFREAVSKARTAAGTPATVLLQGESGTGKELFAHAIHNASGRRNARFIRVNCAALSESVLESELFGYVGGAFTGARRSGRRGLFEEAHGGTIFLDEIGLMSHNTQGKLLRVLQEHEIRRVGGNDPIPIDVRVIAATNLDLPEQIAAGSFREDLYYRLLVVPVAIPPLRARTGDIPMLAERLLAKINGEYGRAVREIEPDAQEVLRRHRWPGNVRELENVLRRAVVSMALDETVLRMEHVPALDPGDGSCADPDDPRDNGRTNGAPADGAPAVTTEGLPPLAEVVAEAEANHIRTVLGKHGGNRTRTAAALGISVRSLQYKMQRYGIR